MPPPPLIPKESEDERKKRLENEKLDVELKILRRPLKQFRYLSNWGPLATFIVGLAAAFVAFKAGYLQLLQAKIEANRITVKAIDSVKNVASDSIQALNTKISFFQHQAAQLEYDKKLLAKGNLTDTQLRRIKVNAINAQRPILITSSKVGILSINGTPTIQPTSNIGLPVNDNTEDNAPVPVVMHITRPIVRDTFEVSGTLVDSNNKPIVGASVTSMTQMWENMDAMTGPTRTPAITNANGRFSLRISQVHTRAQYDLTFSIANPALSQRVRTNSNVRNKKYILSIVKD